MQVGANSPPPSTQYNYLVRIISPKQKTKFITKVWHDVHEKFLSTQQLKQLFPPLRKNCPLFLS